jgi:hypothetical protein
LRTVRSPVLSDLQYIDVSTFSTQDATQATS